MTRTHLPAVGFDRFIRREWLDRTLLELLLTKSSPEVLNTWMTEIIEGRIAARKTALVLARWWFNEYPETTDLRARALRLAVDISPEEWMVLHWGMALVNFQIFHAVAHTVGRLLRLQGEFRQRDVTQRILEAHANVGTIPRAVRRIIQSMYEWKVISKAGNTYKPGTVYAIPNDMTLEWFLEALIRSARHDALNLRDIVRAPEAFPFDIPSHAAHVARQSRHLTVQYEGLNREIITMRMPK